MHRFSIESQQPTTPSSDEMSSGTVSSSVLEMEGVNHDKARLVTTNDEEDVLPSGLTLIQQVCWPVLVLDGRFPTHSSPPLKGQARESQAKLLHIPPRNVNLMVKSTYTWEL